MRTYKPEEYKGHRIYYRNMGMHWEYLLILNNEIYSANITVNPTFVNRLLRFFLVVDYDYSDQQAGNILKYLRRMAETTVDHLTKPTNA